MKFRVYQIHLSKNERLALNMAGRDEAATRYLRVEAYTKIMWSGGSRYWDAKYRPCYEETLAIEADDLNEVFEVGNIGPQRDGAAILPLRKFHSVSVGDIIVTGQSPLEAYMVDPVGFTKIDDWLFEVNDTACENALQCRISNP